jgi:iron complex outermembrane receptor protein
MVIILKDNKGKAQQLLEDGITSVGNGDSLIRELVCNGSSIADDKGFINYTIDFF